MIGKETLTFCFEDFYPSNVPYCHILKDLIEECCSRGYQVKVITSYKYNKKEQTEMLSFFKQYQISSSLFKVGKKTKLSSALFSIRVFFHLLLRGRGTVIIPSTPPVISGFSVFLARYFGLLRFNYVYHCQDIHPEALEISKNIKNVYILNILRKLDFITVKYAKKAVVLSNDMKNTLMNRYAKPLENISVINNFIPSAYCGGISRTNEVTIRSEHTNDDLIFVFAGNLGDFQNLELLLEGFLMLDSDRKPHLYFIGEGNKKQHLKNATKTKVTDMNENVHFLDKMSSSSIIKFISEADFGVVSLSEGLLDVAYPSKIATYLNIGLPIIMCGGTGSTIETEIDKNKLGISFSGDDAVTIKEGFGIAIKESDYYKYEHHRIKSFYQKNYNKEKQISNLIEVFL